MSLIVVPSHGKDNAASQKLYSLYHLLDLKYKQRTKLNFYKPFNDVWKYYSDFVNPAFKSIRPDIDC